MVFNSFAPIASISQTKKRNSIYIGSTKDLMDDLQEDRLVLHFKDTIFRNSFFDEPANRHSNSFLETLSIPGKGILNNRISELFFKRLSERRIQNHFVERINMKEQKIRSCIPFTFNVVIHNYSDEKFSKKMGIENNQLLPEPIIEFNFKDQNKENNFISERHILAFNMATQEEMDDILLKCQRINDFLSGQLLAIDFKLVNFSLEFGRFPNYEYYMDSDVLLIDEISPDTMCLLDMKTGEQFNRYSIFQKIEKNQDVYIYVELAKRLGLLKNETFN
jgi:phosphoribosylaminoimidazole-succinocarboxamide synthase